ncbi:MAG: hypothetical protein H6678_10285 [Candidatus Delongbacteria bacterium]|nr:hypothetical protein [Candidatus Delongbacteria bacterium]
MTPYQEFQNCISAAHDLVKIYKEMRNHRGIGLKGQLDAKNLDLLWLPRSAVVTSLSALDSYIHKVLIDKVPTVLKSNAPPISICAIFAEKYQVKNGEGFRNVLSLINSPDPISELLKKLKEDVLAFQSYQAPEKIIHAYSLIGHDNIFASVADKWPGPASTENDIKRRLTNYVKRRNQIAHEGDFESSGHVRHIKPEYAKDCYEFVEALAKKLNLIVYKI